MCLYVEYQSNLPLSDALRRSGVSEQYKVVRMWSGRAVVPLQDFTSFQRAYWIFRFKEVAVLIQVFFSKLSTGCEWVKVGKNTVYITPISSWLSALFRSTNIFCFFFPWMISQSCVCVSFILSTEQIRLPVPFLQEALFFKPWGPVAKLGDCEVGCEVQSLNWETVKWTAGFSP